MVDRPTNFGSIIGGIIRGLSNDKRSAGLKGSNVTNDNPQSYGWIGQETSDLRQPIEKEQTQNPSLPFLTKSSGVEYSYTTPLPTDIRSRITAGMPGTNVDSTNQASSIGSMIQTVPSMVLMNNWQEHGYGMSPQNGDHFKTFFANQMGVRAILPQPLPSAVANAVSHQADSNLVGSHDVWHSSWQTFLTMRKTHHPSAQYLGT